jgi:hypothetical protein
MCHRPLQDGRQRCTGTPSPLLATTATVCAHTHLLWGLLWPPPRYACWRALHETQQRAGMLEGDCLRALWPRTRFKCTLQAPVLTAAVVLLLLPSLLRVRARPRAPPQHMHAHPAGSTASLCVSSAAPGMPASCAPAAWACSSACAIPGVRVKPAAGEAAAGGVSAGLCVWGGGSTCMSRTGPLASPAPAPFWCCMLLGGPSCRYRPLLLAGRSTAAEWVVTGNQDAPGIALGPWATGSAVWSAARCVGRCSSQEAPHLTGWMTGSSRALGGARSGGRALEFRHLNHRGFCGPKPPVLLSP